MACIKTGADVWLPQYGCLVHGDLFEENDCYLLHCSGPWRDCCMYGYGDVAKPINHIEFWHFSEIGSNVLYCSKKDCSDFNYEGWKTCVR